MKKRGTKTEVFNGLAEKTSGGLKKSDLIQNKRGNIVSKKRSEQGSKQFKNIEPFIKNKGPKTIHEAKQEQLKKEKEVTPDESEEEPAGGGIPLKPDAVEEEKKAELKAELKAEEPCPPHCPTPAIPEVAEDAVPRKPSRRGGYKGKQ